MTDIDELVDTYGLTPLRQQDDPTAHLVALGYGRFVDGTCAPDRGLTSRRWLRLTALPSPDPARPAPLRRMLTAVASADTTIEVVVRHESADGLQCFLGFADTAQLARGRSLLVPHSDVATTATPSLPGRESLGLVYRLQGGEQPNDPGPAALTAIEALSGIDGAWALHLVIRGTAPQSIDRFTDALLEIGEDVAQRVSTARVQSANVTTTSVSPAWTRVQEWLDTLYAQSLRGRAIGLWQVTSWVSSSDPAVLRQVIASLRAAITGEGGRSFSASALTCAAGSAPPTSLLTSADVGDLLAAPEAGVAGLAVRPAPPAARRPAVGPDRLTLGTFWCSDQPAAISVDDLEGHAFVTGTTGAGKTTTLHRLLAEVWNVHRIPFLVIDPVKEEYSEASLAFDGGVRVVTGGQLRLNVLEAWPGRDPAAHATQIAQAFRGAFTMPSPAPYVVTHLFDRIVTQPGGPTGTDLHDLRDALDPLVDRLGYAPEAQANIRAALSTRLDVLLSPARAHRFAWPDSSMIAGLFDRPTVVTLGDLADDEERSFLVLLLAIATWSRARANPAPRPIDHLLILEEAHRVIPEVPPDRGDGEQGSASQVSAQLLTSMLAEVRSFGQQVIVVDQSPARVSSDVLRNTNLKLIHRTVHPQDQTEVGAAIGLQPEEVGLLGALKRGQVIVSTRSEPAPQTVQVAPAAPRFAHHATAPVLAPAAWPCCRASTPAEGQAHFQAWGASVGAAAAMALFLVGLRMGAGDGQQLRQAVYDDLLTARRDPKVSTDCLAWCGLRRILVQERAAGLLGSRKAFESLLGRSYDAWAGRGPVAADRAATTGIQTAARCPGCGERCTVRVPAEILATTAPRTGPAALRSPSWREQIVDVAHWGTRERQRLAPLLGDGPAWHVVRCQIGQAGAAGRVPVEAMTTLLTRSAGKP